MLSGRRYFLSDVFAFRGGVFFIFWGKAFFLFGAAFLYRRLSLAEKALAFNLFSVFLFFFLYVPFFLQCTQARARLGDHPHP